MLPVIPLMIDKGFHGGVLYSSTSINNYAGCVGILYVFIYESPYFALFDGVFANSID